MCVCVCVCVCAFFPLLFVLGVDNGTFVYACLVAILRNRSYYWGTFFFAHLTGLSMQSVRMGVDVQGLTVPFH